MAWGRHDRPPVGVKELELGRVLCEREVAFEEGLYRPDVFPVAIEEVRLDLAPYRASLFGLSAPVNTWARRREALSQPKTSTENCSIRVNKIHRHAAKEAAALMQNA